MRGANVGSRESPSAVSPSSTGTGCEEEAALRTRHNAGKGSDVLKGRMLRVIFTCALVATAASSAPACREYTVRRGDCLWSISRRFGVSIDVLKAANHVSANRPIQIGTRLIIPTGSRIVSSPAKGKSSSISSHTREKNKIGHIGVGAAILRSGPARTSRRLGLLSRGTNLKIVGSLGKWMKVELDSGRAGWVYSALIRPGVGNPATSASADYSTAAQEGREALIRTALASRGSRYRYGGTSRSGFDCSGFTRYIYSHYGVRLPHSSRSQFSCGRPVPRSELNPGDLVFFRTTRRGISHVGIYVGDEKFVHASNYRRGVVVDSLNSGYYASRYVGARRVR